MYDPNYPSLYPRWQPTDSESGHLLAMPSSEPKEPLTIKAFFGTEIRRFGIEANALSWNSLEHEIANLFKLPLNTFTIKYQDSEDDYISISTEKELQLFIASFPKTTLLKLYIEKSTSTLPQLVTPKQELLMSQQQPPSSSGMMTTLTPAWANGNQNFFSSSPSMSRGFGNDEQGNVSWGSASTTSSTSALTSSKKEVKKMKKEKRKRERGQKKMQKKLLKGAEREAWKHQRKADKIAKKHAKKRHKSSDSSADEHDDKNKSASFSPNGGASNLNRKQLKKQQKFEKRAEKKLEKKLKKGSKPLFARFVKHVTIPDNDDVAPGSRFIKTWRLRNDGTSAWPADTSLVYLSQRAGGDQMCSPAAIYLNENVEPGRIVDISVQLIAPESAGFYSGFWRLCGTDKEGKMRKFGQQVWCKIHVLSLSDSERKTKGDRQHHQQQQLISTQPAVNEDSAGSPMMTDQSVTSHPLMIRLSEMGFTDCKANMDALRKNNGDLYRTIEYLSRANTFV